MKIISVKKLFTLLEILIASTIISIILVVVVGIYSNMIKIKYDVEARQSLMQGSYLMLEKLNIVMKDYSIDYEEYFNRAYVGCNSLTGTNFKWDVGSGGYCQRFTTYGNSINSNHNGSHRINYCSSKASTGLNLSFLAGQDLTRAIRNGVVYQDPNLTNGDGCWKQFANTRLGYGQYQRQFWDMGEDIDGEGSIRGDEDDINLGKGPDAIYDNENVKELYLIDKYERKRLILRRALLGTGDFNKNGSIDKDFENYYSLQMLKLKSFDLGADHDSLGMGVWQYDGVIDTWACDYAEGYLCNGASLSGAYVNYKLASNERDGRVTMFGKELTLVDWNLKLYPTKDGSFSFRDDNYQINPYIKIYLKTKLYGQPWISKVNPAILDQFELNLQTTFNVKTFY